MKREQRQIYYILADEAGYLLCSFCKFGKAMGCDSYIDCEHPLKEKSLAFEYQVECASDCGDCWGFRPKHPVAFIADVVGMIIANSWESFTLWQEDGIWKIAGNMENK